MDRTAFWEAIRLARGRKFDCDRMLDKLAAALGDLEPREIADFEKHVLDLKDEAYDARLLEVLWILTGGGPGDEGLSNFQDWLILQGRKTFERILKSPESLPKLFVAAARDEPPRSRPDGARDFPPAPTSTVAD